MLWNVISDSLGRTFILQNRLLKKTGFPSFNYVLFTDYFSGSKGRRVWEACFYKETDTELVNSSPSPATFTELF